MTFPNGYDADILADRQKLRDEELGIFDATSALMGYLHDGDTKNALDQFNNPERNVGGETSGVLLTVQVLFDNMVAEEFGGSQVNDGETTWIRALLAFLISDPRLNIEQYRTKILAIAGNNSQTETNLTALSRLISRVEVLFGDGTKITKQGWVRALEETQ